MGRQKTGRSTIWDAKTRRNYPKIRRRTNSLKRDIDEGFAYFWSKRRVGEYHNGSPS